MVDSIREKVMKNVVSTLEGITADKGYDITIQKVSRLKLVGLNIKVFPTIVVIPTPEPKEQEPVDRYTCRLGLTLECWIKERVNITSEVNQVLANVEKALMVDYTRNGLAIDTKIISNDPFYNETNQPYGGVNIMIEIVYRHLYADPYALG